MSTTSNVQPNAPYTGIVEQKKLDNSGSNAPGIPQQQKFENTGFGTTTTGTQQEQPSYLQQAYDGVSNLLNTAASALPGATTTGTGAPLHPAAQRVKKHHGPTGGVGSLPGTPNEEDVVRLPEERQHPDPLAEERERARLDEAIQKASYAAAAPAGAGAQHQKGEDMTGTGIRPHPNEPGFGASTTTHDSSTTPPSRGMVDTTGTHGVTHTGIHPPRDAPGAGSTTATHNRGATMERPKEAVKDTVHRTTGEHDTTRHEEASPTSPSGTQKASLKDKMKGQAKIISGKMTSDAEKVEEGKALKSAH